MSYTFSQRSLLALSTCEPTLVEIMTTALSWSAVDFGISQGGRTVEQQREYFRAGTSRINPDAYPDVTRLCAVAKHVIAPGFPLSRACDVFVSKTQPRGNYDQAALCYVAGLVRAASILKGRAVRWGGDFDRDGLLLEVGTFQDLPHFELD